MSLEQAIQENNALLRELIDLQKANGSTPAADAGSSKPAAKGKAAAGKPAAKEKAKPTQTAETLKAKLVEYKEATDLKAAKALTKELGYDSIADVPEDKWDEVYGQIDEAIANLGSGDDAGDDDAL